MRLLFRLGLFHRVQDFITLIDSRSDFLFAGEPYGIVKVTDNASVP